MDKSLRPGGSESILRLAMSRSVIKFSVAVALVGGTIINLISQGETLASGDELSLGKIFFDLYYSLLYGYISSAHNTLKIVPHVPDTEGLML